MKLLSRGLLLIITSPYLISFLLLWQSIIGYSPVVSQDFIVGPIEPLNLIGFPLRVEAKTPEEPVEEPIVEQPTVTNSLQICSGAWRDFKSYMNWTALSHSSQQYKFISRYMDTESRDGLLHLKSDTRFIGVALGSYFGKIGSKLKFTLDSGAIFYAVKVEEKSDAHTVGGCVTKHDSSIIEFVVNKHFYNYYPGAATRGSLHVIPAFRGMVVDIEIIN